MMDPADLAVFREVAECLSLRQAAKRLNVAPSAISRRVQRLERELGIRLLDRQNTGVALTSAGSRCLAYAQDVQRGEKRLLADLEAERHLESGHITIHFSEGQLELLAEAISGFRERYPGIRFDVFSGATENILLAVEQGDADIGIAFSPRPSPALETVIRFTAPLLAVVSPSHPLANRGSVTLRDIVDLPLALPRPGFGIRRILDRLTRAEGIELKPAVMTDSIGTMKAFARHRGGATILSYMSITPELRAGTLAAVPFQEEELRHSNIEVCVLGRRRLPPAMAAFLAYLRSQTTPWLLSRWMLSSGAAGHAD